MDFIGNVTGVEWLGYIAMAVVLYSFLMKNVIKLRIVNAIGCFMFTVYGLLLNPISIPIVGTNAAILVINLFFIFNYFKTQFNNK